MDTGAYVNTLNRKTFRTLFPDVALECNSIKVICQTNEDSQKFHEMEIIFLRQILKPCFIISKKKSSSDISVQGEWKENSSPDPEGNQKTLPLQRICLNH